MGGGPSKEDCKTYIDEATTSATSAWTQEKCLSTYPVGETQCKSFIDAANSAWTQDKCLGTYPVGETQCKSFMDSANAAANAAWTQDKCMTAYPNACAAPVEQAVQKANADWTKNRCMTTYKLVDAPIQARYVRIERVQNSSAAPKGDDNTINLAEIIVKNASGQNIASSGTVTTGSVFGTSFGGNMATDNNPDTFVHTAGLDIKKQWVEVDLKTPQSISAVEIINRPGNSFANRLIGLRLVLKDASGKTVFTGNPILTTSSSGLNVLYPQA